MLLALPGMRPEEGYVHKSAESCTLNSEATISSVTSAVSVAFSKGSRQCLKHGSDPELLPDQRPGR